MNISGVDQRSNVGGRVEGDGDEADDAEEVQGLDLTLTPSVSYCRDLFQMKS